MSSLARILVVDDDRDFNQYLAGKLAQEGYTVASALSEDEALKELERCPADLVLLDRKLRGQLGPDTGLDLIEQLRLRAPAAKFILITGYADGESVKRAFQSGVYDYLEKTAYFETILLVKVGNALEAIRERRIAALANGKREEAIKDLWRDTQGERNPKRRGRVLEDLLLVLLKSIPGFERTEANQRSQDEEFDLLVPNESPDPIWQRESQYLLVECKNWSKPVGPEEIDRFYRKLERRHGRCQLGFFVALRGFTDGVHTTLSATREKPIAVVLLQAPELQRLVDAGSSASRNDILKELHRQTIAKG